MSAVMAGAGPARPALALGLLWASAAALVAYGVWSVLDPQASVAALTGLGLGSTSATVEAMAMYGGLQIGLGLFLGAAATRPGWMPPALCLVALTMTGLAVTRLGAMAWHGLVPLEAGYAAVELVLTALAIVAWRRLGGAYPASA